MAKRSHLLWLQQQHHEQEVIVQLHCTHSLLPCATEFLHTAEINKPFQNYKAITRSLDFTYFTYLYSKNNLSWKNWRLPTIFLASISTLSGPCQSRRNLTISALFWPADTWSGVCAICIYNRWDPQAYQI